VYLAAITGKIASKDPPSQSELEFYIDGKDTSISSAKLSAALADTPKRSLAASRTPQNGARVPGTAATGEKDARCQQPHA